MHIEVRNPTLDLTKREIFCASVEFYLELKAVVVSNFCVIRARKMFLPYVFLDSGWKLELYHVVSEVSCMTEKTIKYFLCASLNIYLDKTGFS
jgi:hypothetical protein